MCTNVRAHVIHSKDQLGFFLSLSLGRSSRAYHCICPNAFSCVCVDDDDDDDEVYSRTRHNMPGENGRRDVIEYSAARMEKVGGKESERERERKRVQRRTRKGKRKHSMPTSKDKSRESEVTLVLFLVA